MMGRMMAWAGCARLEGGGVSIDRWMEVRAVGGGVEVAGSGVGLRRFWVRKTAPWALVLRVVKTSASLVKNWEGFVTRMKGVGLVENGGMRVPHRVLSGPSCHVLSGTRRLGLVCRRGG